MRRPIFVTPPRTTPLRAAIGILVNLVLLGLLLARAHSPLAVILGVTVLVVVMYQAEHQGWGPISRGAAGIIAGSITFLVLNH